MWSGVSPALRTGVPAAARALPWWQPWAAIALFAFGLHFIWEMLHAPLYRGLAEQPHAAGILCCLRATAGDAGIALAAYGVVAAGTRDRQWLADARGPRVAWFVAVGLAVTVALELLSVYRWGRWAYGPAMPTIAGVGLSPLLQWVVLPPLTLWLARRHVGAGPSSVHFTRL